MIYACEDCGFLFQRSGEICECPNCDGKRIRSATKEEEETLLKKLETAIPTS